MSKALLRPGRLFLFEMLVENNEGDKRSKKALSIRATLYYKIKQLGVKLPGSQGYWIADDDLEKALESFAPVVEEADAFNEAQELCGFPSRLYVSWITAKAEPTDVHHRLQTLIIRIFKTVRNYVLEGEFDKAELYLREHGSISRAFVPSRARDLEQKLDRISEIVKNKTPKDKVDFSFLVSEFSREEDEEFRTLLSN